MRIRNREVHRAGLARFRKEGTTKENRQISRFFGLGNKLMDVNNLIQPVYLVLAQAILEQTSRRPEDSLKL